MEVVENWYRRLIEIKLEASSNSVNIEFYDAEHRVDRKVVALPKNYDLEYSNDQTTSMWLGRPRPTTFHQIFVNKRREDASYMSRSLGNAILITRDLHSLWSVKCLQLAATQAVGPIYLYRPLHSLRHLTLTL